MDDGRVTDARPTDPDPGDLAGTDPGAAAYQRRRRVYEVWIVLGLSLRPPPEASDLRLRLSGVSLASWAQFMPIAARVTGSDTIPGCTRRSKHSETAVSSPVMPNGARSNSTCFSS